MRITHISTAVIESNFDWTIVKVETDENITGYGEAFLGPGLTAVIRDFAAILKGEDPTSIDRVLRRMRASCVHASPGLVVHAIHGIESALLGLGHASVSQLSPDDLVIPEGFTRHLG